MAVMSVKAAGKDKNSVASFLKPPDGRGLWQLVCLSLVVWLLSGCQTAAAPLPTLLPSAATVALPQPAEAAYVPVTWTPPAGAEANQADNPLSPLGPTRTPTATPIFPTSTPIPPTPTPTETPTPPTLVVIQIPTSRPSGQLGPSKLGLHVIRNDDPNIMEFVRQGQPAVIKVVDYVGFLTEVKAASPRTITIGRLGTPSQDYVGSPEEAARRFVDSQLERYRLNPGVDYWEGWNEPDPGLHRMSWYARFEQERTRLMAQHGFRVAIGGFPTGAPELDEFALFVPAIETAMQYNGILTLHEYGAPDLTYLYGAPLPGMPAYPDRGALKFRYRWFYREILEPAGLEIPLVISEAGVDGIIGNRPGPPGLGWADFQDYWVQQGWGSSGPEAFINQLAWYDDGVRQDGYVIGFTVFTAGSFGYWQRYTVNPILPELTHYVRSQRRR